MRLRPVVWCVIVLLMTVLAGRFAWTASDGFPHRASMKSLRSSPSGWRMMTAASGPPVIRPVLAGQRPDPAPAPERLPSIEPVAPFHPPRG